MAVYTKLYTLTITEGAPGGNTIYTAIDYLEDNIDQVITDLNNCHMTANGDIPYRAAGASTKLAIGAGGKVLCSSGTAPTWGVPPLDERATFTYNGGSTAYTVKVKPGQYWCKDKWCRWTTELTTPAIGTPAGDTWYYLYLDYSAITSNTAVTASELVWSVDLPAWSSAYRAWFRTGTNTDDRCVFAALTNTAPSNILEFFHDGDFVCFADDLVNVWAVNVGTSFQDISPALMIPSFARRSKVMFYGAYAGGAGSLSWRTNGQTGATGHSVGSTDADVTGYTVITDVVCDSNLLIEWVDSGGSSTTTWCIYMVGWYFPIGI